MKGIEKQFETYWRGQKIPYYHKKMAPENSSAIFTCI